MSEIGVGVVWVPVFCVGADRRCRGSVLVEIVFGGR